MDRDAGGPAGESALHLVEQDQRWDQNHDDSVTVCLPPSLGDTRHDHGLPRATGHRNPTRSRIKSSGERGLLIIPELKSFKRWRRRRNIIERRREKRNRLLGRELDVLKGDVIPGTVDCDIRRGQQNQLVSVHRRS